MRLNVKNKDNENVNKDDENENFFKKKFKFLNF